MSGVAVRNLANPNREDSTEPIGGYPMHVMLRIEGTDFALLISGTKVRLTRVTNEPGDDGTYSRPRRHVDTLGTLTEQQVEGLVYHLAYWGGMRQERPPSHANHHDWVFNGRLAQPKFRVKGCSYDY